MSDYASLYVSLFKRFGSPLTERQGYSEDQIHRMESQLQICLPRAIFDFYRVAGRERRFNQAFQRLLPLYQLFVANDHLVFMEECQQVCFWSVTAKKCRGVDGAVYQGNRSPEIDWHRIQSRCSKFLMILLHYQAVCGGMKFTDGWPAPPAAKQRLRRQMEEFGEVNQLWAFSRQNQVVCVMSGCQVLGLSDEMIFAGGATASELDAIRSEFK